MLEVVTSYFVSSGNLFKISVISNCVFLCSIDFMYFSSKNILAKDKKSKSPCGAGVPVNPIRNLILFFIVSYLK
jgi:hypothetical protein